MDLIGYTLLFGAIYETCPRKSLANSSEGCLVEILFLFPIFLPGDPANSSILAAVAVVFRLPFSSCCLLTHEFVLGLGHGVHCRQFCALQPCSSCKVGLKCCHPERQFSPKISGTKIFSVLRRCFSCNHLCPLRPLCPIFKVIKMSKRKESEIIGEETEYEIGKK